MPDHRRNRVERGTYFFTVTLADRRGDLLVKEVDALGDYPADWGGVEEVGDEFGEKPEG